MRKEIKVSNFLKVFCLWEHSQTPFLSVKNNKIKAIAIKVGKALDCDTVSGIPAVWKIV